jgi:Flp pilus assembly protein TadG
MLAAVLLVPMTLCAGGAVDLLRHEKIRGELQDSLDRGVLAAAALNQPNAARATVEGYLKGVGQGATIALTVTEDRQLNSRKVTASASVAFPTAFLGLAGLSTLTVPAEASAQETRQNVEMSLVLDISGSMYDNKGMVQLKPAAKAFIDAVLKEDTRPVTSVSIIPFAGQVSLGEGVFDYLASLKSVPANWKYTRRHRLSSCFEMLDTDFGAAGMPALPDRDQVPHFTFYNLTSPGKKPWWCPTDDASISYLSNDPVYLKKRIDALQPFDGTGTAYAMKWAQLLLDPAMRPAVSAISSQKLAPVPAAFVGRPSAFGDPSTMKFLVLMTDGQIAFQPRPKDATVNVLTDRSVNGIHKEIFSGKVEDQYKRVCDYSKSKGITIFTIAFKISDNNVAKKLAACASNPSFAYRVDGLDIAKAFESIASAIQKLKLIG